MPAALPRTLLSPEHIAMIGRGVSTTVASRSAANQPSVMRAVGAGISPEGTEVTVFVARGQSRQLLRDIADTGEVAVVFSEPGGRRTLELRAGQAALRPVEDEDLPQLRPYLASMEDEVTAVGLGPAFERAMLAWAPGDVVAICFTPDQALAQMPGTR
jgi:hypothetical protein